MGSKKHEKTGAKRNITLKHLFFILSVSSSSIDKDYAVDLEVGRQSHRGLQRNDCLRPHAFVENGDEVLSVVAVER